MSNNEWRDMNRIPKGMSDFKRWFRPDGVNTFISPSDVDGILHTKFGNRFLMMEFKPAMGDITVGQGITLNGFSELPGCTSIVVFDPYSRDTSREKYDDELRLHMYIYKNGVRTSVTVSVAEFNEAISEWFNNKGPLA